MSSAKKIIAQNGTPMLSAKAASKRLKCAADYVGKLCREGKLEGQQIDGAWFVNEASIALFEKARKEARAQRSMELAQQRKNESAQYRKLYGIEEAVAPVEVSAATPTFAVRGLVAPKWGRVAALSFGAAFLFAAVVFAGGSGSAGFFENEPQLAAALGEVQSPFFGAYALTAAPSAAKASTETSNFFGDVFAFLFGAHSPAANIAVAPAPAPAPRQGLALPQVPATHTTATSTAKQTIVQNITYPVVERTVVQTQSGVTQAQLDTQLNQLSNNLKQIIYANAGSVLAPTYSGGGSTLTNLALSQRIDSLSGVAITGGTISGSAISGVTLKNITSIDLAGGCYSVGGVCISGGGAPAWGSITGTLSSQTDLQNALNAKFSLASWYATTTDALAQGSTNLYYSNALVNALINASSTIVKTSAAPTYGKVLVGNTTGGYDLVATSSLGITGGGGTFTSIGPAGQLQTGPSVTLASSTTGSDFTITASGNIITYNLPNASAAARGLLTSSDFTSFTNKISSTSLSAVYPLAYNSTTGVFSTNFGTTTANTFSQLQTFTAGILTNASSTFGNFTANFATTSQATTTNFAILNVPSALLKTLSNGAVVAAVAGVDYAPAGASTFAYPFPNNATSTTIAFNAGLTSFASTTIGNGTQTGGLTISGGATTTGTAYFAATVGIGNMAPTKTLDVTGTGRFTSTLTLGSVLSCTGGQALQTDASGNITCGSIASGGSSTGGGWTTNNIGLVSLATSTDLVTVGASSTLYAKFSILSGAAGTTTLALVPASGQTANILDIYNTSGALGSVFTAAGNFGIGTTSPFAKLSVAGNALISGILNASGLIATNATTTNLAIPGILSGLLATNAQGAVVATTSLSLNYLTQATLTTSGYLSGADFVTFNNKISSTSLSATYPLAYNSSTGIFTTAFSTTTANTYSALNIFNGGATFVGATSTALAVTGSTTVSGQFNAVGGATLGTLTAGATTLASLVVNGATSLQNATTTSLFSASNLSNTAAFGATATTTFLSNGNVGFGTSTPYGVLSLFVASSTYNTNTLFAIASSTSTFATSTLFTINNTGLITGQNFSLANGTTSALAITGITSSLLKTLASGAVVPAVAGTDYLTSATTFGYPFPNNATSTQIAFNGGATFVGATTTALAVTGSSTINTLNLTNALTVQSGGTGSTTLGGLLTGNGTGQVTSAAVSAPLTFSGNTLAITQATLAQNGYLSGTDFVTFNNKISSTSLSATYPLAYNSTTGIFTTAFSTTTANTYSALNTFNNGLTANILTVGTSASIASTTLTGSTLLANATTTTFAIANISNSLLKTLSNGAVVAAIAGTDYATPSALAAAYAFTPTVSYGVNTSATSTPLFAVSGLFASSTSHFAALDFAIATGSNLTTTGSTTIGGQFNAVGGATLGTVTAGTLTLNNALTVQSGGTGSTTLTGILAGNGTSAVKTVVIGSGLTFDGTTIATNGAGITAIGPFGQTQTGGTQLLATSTSGTDFSITASGNTQTFNLPFASLTANGKLASSDFATFQNKISSSSLSGATVISYNSGTGVITTTGGTFGAGNYIFPGNASSSLLSAYGAYFGGSATSSFAANGALTLAQALGVASGGTNNTSFSPNSLLYFDGTKIAATSSNALYVGSLFATTTTATSTLAGGFSAANSLFVLQNGNIGIGNSVPGKTLDITGTARVSSTFTLASNTSCVGGNALQTDVQGNVVCGNITVSGATTGGGWTTNNIGSITLATTTDRVGIGATSTPYAKLAVLSGGAGTTTLALVPASGQTANILDIYNTSGALGSVFTAAGNFGIGTTSPFATLSVAGNGFFNDSLTASNITATGTLSAGGTTLVTTAAGNVGIGSSSPMSRLAISGGNLTHVAAGNPTLATTVPAIAAAHSYRTFVSGNYAYEAEYEGGLRIFDVTNPKKPLLVGTYSTYTAVDDVIVSGKYAYLADAVSGIVILDVSNPTAPTLLGTYAVSSTPYPVSIALSGKYLLATDMNAHAVRVLDVSNPSAPALAGSYVGTISNSPRAVAVSGKYAYVTDFAPAVYVLDISVPSNPTKVSSSYVPTGGGPTSVYISGNYLYVSDFNGKGMYILNASNPTALSLVGTYNPGGTSSYEDVKVAGNYAYLADDASNLVQVDVSNKSTPVLVGSFALGGIGRGVALVGKYAYVSANTQGLEVVDINGVETPSASIGSLATNIANITDSLTIGNDIYAGGGLNVGISGIFSRGGLSVFGSTTLSAPLTVNASTTITGNFTASGNSFFTNATTTSFFATVASTTNLTISSVLGSLLKTNASGQVVAAVAGTDYVTGAGLASAYPFPNNATSTQIAFNGGATFSNATSTGTFAVTGSTTLASLLNVGGSLNANGALTVLGATNLQALTASGNTSLQNATSTSEFTQSLLANVAAFGKTGTSTFTATGALGIGTTSPYALLSLFAASSTTGSIPTTLFAISSTTSSFATSTLFSISNTGLVTGLNFNSTGSTTVAGAFNSVASNLLGSTTLLGNSLFTNATTTNFAITGTANTLLKTLASGAVVPAVAGTDYANFAYPFIASATSSVLTFSGGIVSNGSTTISSLGSGLVGSNNGLLYGFASTSLFGYTPLNPTRLINTTYPLQGGGDLSADRTLTLAFGTTTQNFWSNYNNFSSLFAASASTTNATTTNLHITSLVTGGLAVDNNGRVYSSATSTLATISGTLALTQLANQAANTVLVNNTSASAAPVAIATSSFFGTGTGGQVLAWNNGVPQWIASTTYTAGNGIATSFAGGALTITNTIGYPFPSNATNTQIAFNGGATFIGATTTALAVTGSTTISGQFNALGGATLGTLTAGATTLASLTVNGNTSLQNATTTSLFSTSHLSNTAAFGQTGTTTITSQGFLGVGTTSPYALLSLFAASSTTGSIPTTLFAISSTTSSFATSTLFTISNTGLITGGNFSLTNGTSSTFAITGVTSSILKTLASGAVVAAVAGTDYANFAYPFIASATSSVLTFSGGIVSNGSTTISSLGSGLVGNNNGLLYSFASSSLFGFTPASNATTLTINGTANQLTSSAGAQDLTTNRTWTLSLPNHVIFPTDFVATAGSTTNATSSTFAITGITSSILKTLASGAVVPAVAGVDYQAAGNYATFTWPFTPTTNFGATANSTSTPIFFTAGLQASSTSHFANLDYTGTLNFASTSANASSTLFSFRGQSLLVASTTGFNTGLGLSSISANTSGSRNTALGAFALQGNTIGSSNVAIGYGTLQFNDGGIVGSTGSDNIAVGDTALTNSSGNKNVALGSGAIGGNSNTGSGNIGIGYIALTSNTTGSDNVSIGNRSGQSNTTGYGNVLLGVSAGNLLTTGFNNVLVGDYTFATSSTASNSLNIGGILFGTIPATSTAFQLPTSGSLGVGTSSPFAKFAIQSNNGDTSTTLFAIGSSTQSATSTLFSVSNTGSTTLFQLNSSLLKTNANGTIVAAVAGTDYQTFAYPFTATTNFGSVANSTSTPIWFTAGLQASSTSHFANLDYTGTLNFASTSASASSTLFSFNSQTFLTASTTGFNTGVGLSALANITRGSSNTALGYQSLLNATSTSNNVGIGYQSLKGNASQFTGNKNVAVGRLTLQAVTTGSFNNAFGDQTLTTNTSGAGNNAFGSAALFFNSTGGNNSAFGNLALQNTLGSDNTAFGADAGYSITSGYGNTLIGSNSTLNNTITTGGGNIGLGVNIFFPDATANNQLNLGGILFGNLPATSTAFQLPTSGSLGVGTSSPFAKFAIQTNNGDTATTLFAIGSSTQSATSTLFSISNTGSTTIANGINISAGCFAVNGSCLQSAAFSYPFPSNATTTQLAFNGGATFIGATTTALAVTGSSTIAGQFNAVGGATFGSASINTLTLGTALSVANGGTGATSFTSNGLVMGNGTGQLVTLTTGNNGFLVSDGSGNPSWSGTNFSSPTHTFTWAASNGWVGLGTTSPFAKFSIQANSNDPTAATTLFAIGSSTQSATSTLFSVSNTGLVGIGTTSPSATFAINGGSGQIVDVSTSGGASAFHITSAGNVGIGVTAPLNNLSVTGISQVADTAGGGLSGQFSITTGTGGQLDNKLEFGVHNSDYSWIQALQAGTAFRNLLLNPGGGNVGIGTTTPANVLDVNGGITTNGGGAAGVQAGPALSLFYDTALGQSTIYSLNSTVTWKPLKMEASTFSFVSGASAQGLYQDGSGNVGIGNTSPTYKLDVTGYINTDVRSGYKQEGKTILYASSSLASVAVGESALNLSTTGSQNVAVGSTALTLNTSGSQNTAVGQNSLSQNTTGGFNTAIGKNAVSSNTGGTRNVGIGYNASGGNTAGTATVAIGTEAAEGAFQVFVAKGYVAVGDNAGLRFSNGADYNTLLGYQSGSNITSGYANILIGASTDENTLSTGKGNIGLGNNLFFPSNTANSQLNIGNLVYGTLPATSTAFLLPTSGAIGIGTSSPFAKFAIQSNNGDTARTLFAVGSSTQSATTTLFSISNIGNVSIGASSIVDAPLRITFNDNTGGVTGLHIQNTNGGANAFSGMYYFSNTDTTAGSVFQGFNNSTHEFRFNNVATTPSLNFLTGSVSRIYVNSSGNVGVGTTSPEATFTVVGSICAARAAGVQTAACTNTAGQVDAHTSNLTGGFDVAETYPTLDTSLVAGDIVGFDPVHPVYVARAATQSNFLGVVSTAAALTLGDVSSSTRAIAMAGRVPVKVNLEGGPIAVGDAITISSIPGVGAKATSTVQTVGVALEPYNGAGIGTIQVFIKPELTLYGDDIAAIKKLSPVSKDISINADGSLVLGTGATSTITINAGTIAYSNPATTTVAIGTNVWTIATSTSTGTLPIIAISAPASSTPSVSINGSLYLNGQDITSVASTSATTTPAVLVQGPFAAATDALKSAISSALGALQNIAQLGVRQLGAAVYATVGTFNQVFTQTLTATDINADTVTANKLCLGTTCVTQTQLQNLLNGSTSTAPATGAGGTSSTTPLAGQAPTITINGANPATITVGTTYNDLGALATDNAGNSLTVHTFVNGSLLEPVIIDTSSVATDTIDYVATDTWGNTATGTRTLIIQ